MENPYSPPTSKVSDPPPSSGSPVKAVAFGVATDLGGTIVSGTVLAVIHSIIVADTAKTPEEVTAALQDFGKDGWSYLLLMLLGCGFSILGGYVCSRISRRTDYRLGFITGGISVAFGWLMSWSQAEALMHVLLAIVTVICVLVGVKVGMPRIKAQE